MPGFGARAGFEAGEITELNRELRLRELWRVMDTTRTHVELGYQPKWTTVEAFDD